MLSDEGGRTRPDFKILTAGMTVLKDEDAGDGKRRIRCIASSSVKDLHGDTMTAHCVRSMAKQAQGLTIFLNHKYTIPEDVFGTVEKSTTKRMSAAAAKVAGYLEKDSSSNEDVVLLQLDILVSQSDRSDSTFSKVADGVRLGVSIGALILDYSEDPDADPDSWFVPLIINEVDLLEASIVGIPANPLSWVENATKGLILRGAVPGADENTFNRMRRAMLAKVAVEEAPVADDLDLAHAEVVDETGEPDEPEPDEPESDEPEPEEAKAFDGPEEIIAHYQFAVENKTMSSTDLDAMEDAVASSIEYAIAHGAEPALFDGRTAAELASEILNSEPAPDEPDAADADADPTDDQEAPDASVPESGDAGVDGEAEKQAEAQIEALREGGALNGLTETVILLGEALASLIAERAKSAGLEAANAELTTKLVTADANVKAAVEFVNKFMSLPLGRKSVVQREAAGFAERLKGGPYSAELLSYIAKNNGGTDAP